MDLKTGFVCIQTDIFHALYFTIVEALVFSQFGSIMYSVRPHPSPVCDHVRGAHPHSNAAVHILRMSPLSVVRDYTIAILECNSTWEVKYLHNHMLCLAFYTT